VVDGGAGDISVEEERRPLDLLANEKAERGKHGDAAVGDLRVGVALRLSLVDVVEEAECVDAGAERGASLFRRGQKGKGKKNGMKRRF
jgi:hypothetical protein